MQTANTFEHTKRYPGLLMFSNRNVSIRSLSHSLRFWKYTITRENARHFKFEGESSTFFDCWNRDDFAISKWHFCVLMMTHFFSMALSFPSFFSTLFSHFRYLSSPLCSKPNRFGFGFRFAILIHWINWTAVSLNQMCSGIAGIRFFPVSISNIFQSTSCWWLLLSEQKNSQQS